MISSFVKIDKIKIIIGLIGSLVPFLKPYILYSHLVDSELVKYFFIIALAAMFFPVSTLGFSEYSALIKLKYSKYWNKYRSSFVLLEFYSLQIPALLFLIIAYVSTNLELYDFVIIYFYFVSQCFYLATIRHKRIYSGTHIYSYIGIKSVIELSILLIYISCLVIDFRSALFIEIISILIIAFFSVSFTFNFAELKIKFKMREIYAMSVASFGNVKYNVLSSISLNGDRVFFKYILPPDLYVKFLFSILVKNSILSFFSIINNYLYSYFVNVIFNNKKKLISFSRKIPIVYLLSIFFSTLLSFIYMQFSIWLPAKYQQNSDFYIIFLIILYSLICSNQFMEWYFLYRKKFNVVTKSYLISILSILFILYSLHIINSIDLKFVLISLVGAVFMQHLFIYIKFKFFIHKLR